MTASASSVLYHVNPDEGAKPCGVTVGTCPYGADSPHFETEKEANDEFKRQMEIQHDPFAPVKRTADKTFKKSLFGLPPVLKNLDLKLSEMDYDEVYDYASLSEQKNNDVRKLVKARNQNSENLTKTLEKINPVTFPESAISTNTFMRYLEESRLYRRETAILDRACTASAIRLRKTSAA